MKKVKKEKQQCCEIVSKGEKYCFIFGAIMAVLVFFVIFPFVGKWSEQKELEFQKEFFSRYHNYDEIVDDYFPDEKIKVKVREFPSGKLVTINYGERKYFVRKDLSYSKTGDEKRWVK